MKDTKASVLQLGGTIQSVLEAVNDIRAQLAVRS